MQAFDLLARRLDGACIEWAHAFPGTPSPDSVVRVAGRLNRAPLLLTGVALETFIDERRDAGGEQDGDARLARDFADMLVHELGSPLNAAEVAAVLLESDRLAPGSQEVRRLAGLIQRNLRRIRALIADARELALLNEGQDRVDPRLPVGQVLADVIAELALPAREAKVRLDVEEPIPALPVHAARVRVVLRNLISNSIKYADPKAPVRWVRVSFEPVDGSEAWTVIVSDNGLGIPQEQHERVLERFVRLNPDVADGTGLGLAIASETARRLGGELLFDSEPGVGSSFRFTVGGLEP